MAYLKIWRDQLKHDLKTFALLAKEDRSIDLIYGITAAAVLWGVRDASFNDEQRLALREACGNEQNLPHLLRAVGDWDAMTPLDAARTLSKRQRESNEIRTAIGALISTFIEELFAENMVQRQHIDISGTITGGNIVIGGNQIVAGDLIIKHTRPIISTCPTAPKPPDHFIGREAELSELRERLTGDGIVAITAVRAMGGMGKTALAQALCHQPNKLFDAVLWANIGEKPHVTSILLEWARYAVDDYTLKPDANLEEIAAWVRGQLTQLMNKSEGCGNHWLVVFDDVWNNQHCYQAITLLQTALPIGIKTLITTRQGDTATQLRATSIELYELSDDNALNLLQKLRDNRHITNDHLRRTVELIRGHPLTLELAIASLNNALNPADISTILDDYERGIHEGSPFDALNLGVETPRMLNVVFGRSYRVLAESDQANFRALGALPVDSCWTQQITQSIWQIYDKRESIQAHKNLWLVALMQQDQDTEFIYREQFFRQHPVLHAYARALLIEKGELNTVFWRYTDHIILETKQFKTLSLVDWLQLNPLIPHVNEVGERLEVYFETALNPDEQLLRRIEDFAHNVGTYVENRPQIIEIAGESKRLGIRWLEIGLESTRKLGNQEYEAEFCGYLGRISAFMSQLYKSLEYFECALTIERKLGRKPEEAGILYQFGKIWHKLDEHDKALYYYQETLNLMLSANYRGGLIAVTNAIGELFGSMGKPYKKLEFLEQALQLSREDNHNKTETSVLHNLGGTWLQLNEPRKALDYYEQSLRLSRSEGDHITEAVTLGAMGVAWSKLGDYHNALMYFEEALQAKHLIGDYSGEVITLTNMGEIHLVLKNFDKAIIYFEQALVLCRKIDDRPAESTILNQIGVAWCELGEMPKALPYFEQALLLRRLRRDHDAEAVTCYNIGAIYSTLGVTQLAVAYLKRCVHLRSELNHSELESNSRLLNKLQQQDYNQSLSLPYDQKRWKEYISAQFYEHGSSNFLPGTFSEQQLWVLMNKTVEVMTICQDYLPEWRRTLNNLRMEWSRKNASSETAFIEELIAVLGGATVSLPPDNPYANYLIKILDALHNY
jgi:tetratricopeptide (TPR) repeat protein